MATLRDIRSSILSMPASEVIEIHRAIRQSRRTSKRVVTAKAEKTSGVKKRTSMMKLVEGMSQEDIDRLIAKLEE